MSWTESDIAELKRLRPDLFDKSIPPQQTKSINKGNPLPRYAAAVSKNKYHAKRTWSELCQRTFDSKAEAVRGEELALLLKAAQIDDLRYQVRFRLCDKPKIDVTLDFSYLEIQVINFDPRMVRVFEDVKGYQTRDSRTRYAWLEQRYGVHVNLVK